MVMTLRMDAPAIFLLTLGSMLGCYTQKPGIQFRLSSARQDWLG